MMRTNVTQLPANARQCDGPLLYSLNHWVTPNGDFFKVAPKTGRITQLKATGAGRKYYSWGGAQHLLTNGETQPMEAIEGIFVRNKGVTQVLIRALVCYYFVEKIDDPTGLRADLIIHQEAISPENLHWISKDRQTDIRMVELRAKVNPENIHRIVNDPIDLTEEYTEWNGYFIKNDGTRVLKALDSGMREINIRISSDGYPNVMLRIEGHPNEERMNRLMIKVRGIDITDKVIDHIDGNPLNNRFENLAVVDNAENIRRGGVATEILKIDPTTMKIVERIRCIREYTDAQGEEWDHKALSQRIDAGDIYNNFLWFDTISEGIVYKIIHDDIIVYINRDDIVNDIREKIHDYATSGRIQENMLPLNAQPTAEMETIISELDSRGHGNEEYLNNTNVECQKDNRFACCRVLSYFGHSDASQIVLCLKTLVVFMISRDNLINISKSCPLCTNTHESDGKKMVFKGPEETIPIYSYAPARHSLKNPYPLRFGYRFPTWRDAFPEITDQKKMFSAMKPLRKTLFGKTTGNTGNRSKCKGLYYSFYPPRNDHMDETNPNWLLQRRMSCAAIVAMRNYVLK